MSQDKYLLPQQHVLNLMIVMHLVESYVNVCMYDIFIYIYVIIISDMHVFTMFPILDGSLIQWISPLTYKNNNNNMYTHNTPIHGVEMLL